MNHLSCCFGQSVLPRVRRKEMYVGDHAQKSIARDNLYEAGVPMHVITALPQTEDGLVTNEVSWHDIVEAFPKIWAKSEGNRYYLEDPLDGYVHDSGALSNDSNGLPHQVTWYAIETDIHER
jgi:hypothetical protein